MLFKSQKLSSEPAEPAKQRHVVYLSMRPVESVRDWVSDGREIVFGTTDGSAVSAELTSKDLKVAQIREAIRKYLKGSIDFTALLALLVAEHWAISVNGQYYHLRKMPDGSLGLDLDPFTQREEFLKIPLWKTELIHEERLGIAVQILARMSGKKFQEIPVLNKNVPISQDGFVYSKYRTLLDLPGTGKYNAIVNNCQHFGNRYFFQVYVPTTFGLLQWSETAKDMVQLWGAGVPDAKTLTTQLWERLKNRDLSVEFLLEQLLKSSSYVQEDAADTVLLTTTVKQDDQQAATAVQVASA